MGWTPGDVSASEVLTDADHLYAEHVNELRQAVDDLQLNVKSYGALGDGFTDDFAAIQAAMDDAYGKTIFFPAGRYIIGSPLSFNTDKMKLIGDGKDRTTLTATGGALFTNDGSRMLTDVEITRMRFYTTVTPGTINCFDTDGNYWNNIRINNCMFSNRFAIDINIIMLNCTIEDNEFGYPDTPVMTWDHCHVKSYTDVEDPYVNLVTFKHNVFNNSRGLPSVWLKNGGGPIIFESNNFENNKAADDLIILNRINVSKFFGNWFEGNESVNFLHLIDCAGSCDFSSNWLQPTSDQDYHILADGFTDSDTSKYKIDFTKNFYNTNNGYPLSWNSLKTVQGAFGFRNFWGNTGYIVPGGSERYQPWEKHGNISQKQIVGTLSGSSVTQIADVLIDIGDTHHVTIGTLDSGNDTFYAAQEFLVMRDAAGTIHNTLIKDVKNGTMGCEIISGASGGDFYGIANIAGMSTTFQPLIIITKTSILS